MGAMTDPESLVHQLGRVVRDLGEDHPLTWRVCHAVTDILGADGASITIENSSVARVTLCTTGETAELLENLQDVLEEGPCRDAFATGRPSESRLDGEAVARWPEFIPAAEKIIGPDGALWSFPMRSAGAVIGTVSLHQRQSEPLAVSVSGAQILIDAVADLLVQDPLALAPLSAATGEGWSSRALVQQATGVLAAQLHISIGDALTVLRSYAFTTGSQLRDVAHNVLNQTLDLSVR
jgi:ANTAR domain-containing protein